MDFHYTHLVIERFFQFVWMYPVWAVFIIILIFGRR
jgi:hypothetical protein